MRAPGGIRTRNLLIRRLITPRNPIRRLAWGNTYLTSSEGRFDIRPGPARTWAVRAGRWPKCWPKPVVSDVSVPSATVAPTTPTITHGATQ